MVFLHSPERTLVGLPVSEGRYRLAAACEVLAEAVTAGLCGAWGIASWDPRSVVEVIDDDASGIEPGALLLRAGLSVPDPVLGAGEQLSSSLAVATDRRWGMSPFGGSTADEAWRAVNLSSFLPSRPALLHPASGVPARLRASPSRTGRGRHQQSGASA